MAIDRMRFVVFVAAALQLFVAGSCAPPCDYHTSVDISRGIKAKDGTIFFEGELYSLKNQFVYKDEADKKTSHVRGCVCELKKCMRKCCPAGQAFHNNSCVDTNDPLLHPFNPPLYAIMEEILGHNASSLFQVLVGVPCNHGKYLINPALDPDDTFYLQGDGELMIQDSPEEPAVSHNHQQYCVDAWITDPMQSNNPNWTTQYLALVCFPADDKGILFYVFPIGMLISIPFLVVTFLVYAFIPELRNLHGKALMMYVFGLIVAYCCLSTVQLSGDDEMRLNTEACHVMAFLIYFFFMVSFFWLNVMCVDIWLTFSGFRAPRGGRRAAERRRFLLYCLYAWGMPLVLTSIFAVLQFHPNLPDYIVHPGIADKKCWFPDKNTEFLYFYTPVIILVICNLMLFGHTAFKIVKIKRETAMLSAGDNSRNDQYQKDKQRFNLYLKLFIVMGVNWVAEWLSFLIGGNAYWWIISDFCNTIQGVFIFFIFVFKRKIKILLLKRYHNMRYGSAGSKTRSSSQYRSGRGMSSTMDTEKSFVSHDESAIHLTTLK